MTVQSDGKQAMAELSVASTRPLASRALRFDLSEALTADQPSALFTC
jgi:hypothetical protein